MFLFFFAHIFFLTSICAVGRRHRITESKGCDAVESGSFYKVSETLVNLLQLNSRDFLNIITLDFW